MFITSSTTSKILVLSLFEKIESPTHVLTYDSGDYLRIDGIAYAAGAGLDTSKVCLDGTRTEILTDIVSWIDDPRDDVPRVMWLHGVAGKGKSAIAHTVTHWYKNSGALCSLFCFDLSRVAERRHEKLFSTVARDLAHRDIRLRKMLSAVISADHSLQSTIDVNQQWNKLIFDPLSEIGSTLGPIVIVIDGLDETGGWESRENLLRVLADVRLTKLPTNIRILVTSRASSDISAELYGRTNIQAKSMDDISPNSAEHDLELYIEDQLCRHSDDLPHWSFYSLAQQADGLFEWARLACVYIRGNTRGFTVKERYEHVVSPSTEARPLLDDMYHLVLKDMIDPSEKVQERFRSVMRQVLGTREPLPRLALNQMRSGFPNETDRSYQVETILVPLAALLTGIDMLEPVRPLHTSFRDFLLDESRSGNFYIDMTNVDHTLAFAALKVMEQQLCFNICGLETSYLPNSDVPDLDKRREENISSALSYSCRSWGAHLQIASKAFDHRLAVELQSFLTSERMLFWIEALSLLGELSNALDSLYTGSVFLEASRISCKVIASQNLFKSLVGT